jgi:antitoxin (DNA-binding transcriptional repressor) of toxin-antitoxin stability system
MRTATVRELRTHFPELEALLFSGETIAITKRRRVVATLVPATAATRPDFKARFGAPSSRGGRKDRNAVRLLVEDRGE